MYFAPLTYSYFFVPFSSSYPNYYFNNCLKSQEVSVASEPGENIKIQASELNIEIIKQEKQEKNHCLSFSEKIDNGQISGEKSQMEKTNYPMKNTQSNLVNQVFAFLINQYKTSQFLQKYLQDSRKIKSFYQTLRNLKKYKKKYVNRKYLEKLCVIKEKQIGYKMLVRSLNKMNVLSVKEFQTTVAILTIHYLKQKSDITILTSRKLNSETINDHLKRKREICISLQNTFSSLQ